MHNFILPLHVHVYAEIVGDTRESSTGYWTFLIGILYYH